MPAAPRPPSLPLPRRDGGTLRTAIYRACLDAIVDGRMPAGTRLPSARQLAADWRVSRNTVDDAIAALQADGVLVRRVGAGTFVAAAWPRRAGLREPSTVARTALAETTRWSRRAAERDAPGAMPRPQPFVAGLPDLDAFPLDRWRRLTASRLRASGRDLLGYAPPAGLPALRTAVARHLALARGLACAPEQVMIVNSTMQAVDLAARVLLERGERAWIEDPGFPNLRTTLAMAGVRAVPVPVDAQALDVEAGRERAPRAALAHVSPSCHYPLGVALSAGRRTTLLDWAAQRGAWILEDDYQGDFPLDARAPAPLAALDRSGRVLHLGTFTNAAFPSLRLAWIVLPAALVPTFEAVRAQLDHHSNAMAQAVLADFMDGGHLAAHLRRMRTVYASRRDALLAALERHGVPADRLGPTHAGMHVALHLPRARPDRVVAARAAELGIAAMPLSRYASVAKVNGLLLGYAALDERELVRAAARLAPLVR
ncbi:MAG TPA: PLP-dependent aminotransferase family protein [Casimicrobiaceae bacterium]|nr:PLP-dependent aminotransferase family protein [Casimicrobiaceae bacterium]